MSVVDSNAGLSSKEAEVYEIFDACTKPCTVYGCGINAHSVRNRALAVINSKRDTSICLTGIKGISCPYLTSQVRRELELLVSPSGE